MKKTWIAVVLFALLVTVVQNADARLREGKPMFLANLMYTDAKLSATDARGHGWGLGAAFEQVAGNKGWAFGLSFAWAQIDENMTDVELSYTTFPTSLYGKYYFLDGEFHPCVGAGFGIHLSKETKTTEADGTRERSDSGFNFIVPIGFMWEATENLGITVFYQATYTDAQFFSTDLVHVIQIGLAFK